MTEKSFKNWQFEIFLLATLLPVIVWSFIDPHERGTWWLEAAPVLIALPMLIASRETFRLSHLIYLLIWIHAQILLIGAHYTYALVPAFDTLGEWMGWERNHYDRLGHLVQGFVPVMIGRELLLRTSPLRPGKWLVAVLLLATLGISSLYEIIEWLAAEIGGQGAESFLGTQGDVWDTQKDMLLALGGAALALATLGRLHDRQLAAMKE